MEKVYYPQNYESKIYKQWESTGAFTADVNSEKKPFTICLPPPNATGQLHVGHAMMIAIEDILIRWHRMMGEEALWVPGTDHAAIATENVVLQKIKEEEGIEDPRKELGREEILHRIHQYVASSQDTIRGQIRAMGASCDWSRERYTMDPQLNRCVNSVFTRMFEDGLIYRGMRIINWDTTLQTTISDDEIEYIETPSVLYHIKYGPFVVATSRPETKLADTGIAVHPEDSRYQQYIGQIIEVNWPNGPTIHVKVFADTKADMTFGSGVIGVTPAHSQVDFQMAQEHDLEIIQIIDEDGKMMANAGKYQGMTVKECRKAFVADLEAAGLLEQKVEYMQALPICYRSKQPIEPLPKEQWFINVNLPVVEWKGQHQSLKEILIETVRQKEIQIVPERFDRTYFHWVENLRDWSISRQIWWGHRVPVWYQGEETYVGVTAPQSEGWEQDPDTLDTWFSSALWTWSTLIDPEQAKDFSLSFEELVAKSPDLHKFHPTQVMETGYDILFFWVARMILMTTYMLKEIPFEYVYLHGLVRTKEGKKMSKSDPLTCIDPLESIADYGADALRLALISGSAPGMDSRLYAEKLESHRRFVNKVWNAGRYVMMTLPENIKFVIPTKVHSKISQWFLHRLNQKIESIHQDFDKFRLADVASQLRALFWGDFCDWYLEMVKSENRSHEDDIVLFYAYTTLLKLLHPFIPFITEALWEKCNFSQMLILADLPTPLQAHDFSASEKQISVVQEAITQIRMLREKANLGLHLKINAKLESEIYADLFEEQKEMIMRLARLAHLEVSPVQPTRSQSALSRYFEETRLEIEATAIDLSQEISSLQKKLQKEQQFLMKSNQKLQNQGFLKKAPSHVIDQLKDKVESTVKMVEQLEQQIEEMQQMQE